MVKKFQIIPFLLIVLGCKDADIIQAERYRFAKFHKGNEVKLIRDNQYTLGSVLTQVLDTTDPKNVIVESYSFLYTDSLTFKASFFIYDSIENFRGIWRKHIRGDYIFWQYEDINTFNKHFQKNSSAKLKVAYTECDAHYFSDKITIKSLVHDNEIHNIKTKVINDRINGKCLLVSFRFNCIVYNSNRSDSIVMRDGEFNGIFDPFH